MPRDHDEQQVFDLYDDYCHGRIERREFFSRSAAITVAGVSGLTLAQSLLPNYAEGQEVLFTDERIKATWVDYDSPGGNSGRMRGYLVRPNEGDGPWPAVLVIHENRGLNPYVKDVARRAATAGFLALAPDGLSPVGGYPGNDDDGRTMQRNLDGAKLRVDMVNSAHWLKAHKLSTGKLGATGFCWGGSTTNHLAVVLGDQMQAGVPFYGGGPDPADVPKIKAAMMVQYAENDGRVNATRPGYEAALRASGATFEMHTYPGTGHGFHNYSTSRYDEEQARIAWDRTIAWFHTHLS